MHQPPTSTPASPVSRPDEPESARWKVHRRRTVYESDWVDVYLDDVELPDGTHIDHHVLTMPKASQTAVVLNDARDHVLLIWRHRFITDRWGWEVPAGWVEPGEDPEDSIRREILEETGHRVHEIAPMVEYDAVPGLSTMHFTAWVGHGTTQIGPVDSAETTQVSWHPLSGLADLLQTRAIFDGPSLTSLAVFGVLDNTPIRRP